MELDTQKLTNTYPLEQEFIQQTFLGASIIDFSVNLGLNSSSSTLSVRLVEDDLNYGTSIRKNSLRDAVSEGYHAWNRKAWPKKLTDNVQFSADWPLAMQEGKYPNYGVIPESANLSNFNYVDVTLDTQTAKGDIFYPPEAGSPVYFKYFMASDLNDNCIEQENRYSTGKVNANEFGNCVDAGGAIVYVEDAALGGDQNACEAAGGRWNVNAGKCERPAKRDECGNNDWVEHSLEQGCENVFEFNGIFKKFERTQGTSGTVYNVEIVDPRVILENMTVVLKDLAEKTAPNDAFFIIHEAGEGHRLQKYGFEGMSNILNVFGYYEASGFGNSKVNESGMIWNDPLNKIGDIKTEYPQVGFGILPALNNMLNNFEFRNEDGVLISDYIKNGEPFGGPPTYGIDYRTNQDKYAPYAHRTLERLKFQGVIDSLGLHRYKVDLTDLINLSEDHGNESAYCQDISVNPPIPALDNFGDPLLAKDCVDTQRFRWVPRVENGVLPYDFRINADKISLLSLIEEVCNTASVDFYVTLEKPKRSFYENTGLLDIEERYAGVIKIKTITRKNSLVTPAYDLLGKIENKNYLSLAIDLAIDEVEPQGPFTKPLLDPTNAKHDATKRQSILSSAELGYEYGEPVSGAIMYGGRYSRVAGVTPLGDRRDHDLYKTIPPFVGGLNRVVNGRDYKYTYLPYIELDGVQLRHNDFLVDSFSELDNDEFTNPNYIDKNGHTWNDYGYELVLQGTCSDPAFDNDEDGCKNANETFTAKGYALDPSKYPNLDYYQTGPQFSNDNFLPFHFPIDYKTSANEFDADQLNRVNSASYDEYAANAGTCDGPYNNRRSCISHGTCTLVQGSVTKAVCDNATGTWTAHVWTEDPEEHRSGYLDIYPCWGFEQRSVVSSKFSASFDDIVEVKIEEKPIKGMFWDDDPYRDFHPTDGIFSVFEFYNPGLGECINQDCALQGAFAAKCFEKGEDGKPTLTEKLDADGNPITAEADCESGDKGRGTCTNNAPDLTKAECEQQGGTWNFNEVFIGSLDELNKEFGDNLPLACQAFGGESNKPIPKFKNRAAACLCDPLAQVSKDTEVSNIVVSFLDECAEAHTAAGLDHGWKAAGGGGFEYDPAVSVPRKRWESYCSVKSSCKSHDSNVEIGELNPAELGAGNSFHLEKNFCEMGCFTNDGNKVVAFYIKDAPSGKTAGTTAGNPDGSEDWTNGNIDINGKNDFIQVVLDSSHCDQYKALNPNNQNLTVDYKEIGPDGSAAEEDANGNPLGNKFSSTGGPYSPKCQAISFHAPYRSGCVKKTGNSSPIGNWKENSVKYLDVDSCYRAIEDGKDVEWVQRPIMSTGGPINDHFYGKVVAGEDNPQPGYVVARHRLKMGKCVGIDEDGVVTPKDVQSKDSSYRPNIVRDTHYKPPQDCYEASQGEGSIDYTYNNALSYMWVPRTATIPIEVDGYGTGGSLLTNELGGSKNKWEDPIGAYSIETRSIKGYYMATVTELRHAAVSFESWKNYLKAFAPHLPCWMYAQNPTFNSVWRDLCPALSLNTRLGVGTAAVDTIINIAEQLDGGPVRLSASQDAIVGRKKRAEKYTGTGQTKSGALSAYERTKMELDRAYKAVRNVAVNFYGRKFLVPLPIIPPKKEYCSGFSDKNDPANQGNATKDTRYQNRADCEANGFIWGAHADLSKMVDNSGIEDISNWEIVDAAWPGSQVVDFSNTVSPDSFPTNLNFWNDEGNLRAFALFPEKVTNRIDEQIQFSSFENFDPEQVQITDTNILKDLERSKHPELTAFSKLHGNKVYVEIDVDPKIHWLDDISLHENSMGHKYFMNEAGNNESSGDIVTFEPLLDEHDAPIVRTAAGITSNPPAYLTVGTKNEKEDGNRLDDRSLFKLGDINGQQVANGHPPFDPFDSFPKRPYALITLPEKVLYQTNDKVSKIMATDNRAGNRQDKVAHRQYFEIPLSETVNTKDILKSWTGHQYLNMSSMSDYVALTSVANWLDQKLENPHKGVDVDRMGMVAAAMKPWHAGIPQESNHYRWGPWSYGEGAGKMRSDIDPSYAPGVFGGTQALDNAGTSNVRNKVQMNENNALMLRVAYETGSVTLASGPEHKLGSQPKFDFPQQLPAHLGGHPIPPIANLSPYVTDISVNVSANGISTRYGFNTQAAFGDIGKIYENRIRDGQRDSLRQFKKQENDLRRTKRNIRDYRDT